jgi:hypothetical protein
LYAFFGNTSHFRVFVAHQAGFVILESQSRPGKPQQEGQYARNAPSDQHSHAFFLILSIARLKLPALDSQLQSCAVLSKRGRTVVFFLARFLERGREL